MNAFLRGNRTEKNALVMSLVDFSYAGKSDFQRDKKALKNVHNNKINHNSPPFPSRRKM